MKKTTIFKQLVFNVLVPVLIAFIGLAVLNYYNTKNILIRTNLKENKHISDEIKYIVDFQDKTLNILEIGLNKRMGFLSNILVNKYFTNTENIASIDLDKIRQEIGMPPKYEDIYIINKKGIVVNTTFIRDKNLNFFSFGEKHKKFLLDIFNGDKFVSDRITIEATTKRIKKYSYQPTKDGKYIIEIGMYSDKADEITKYVENTLIDISNKRENIILTEFFIWADKPILIIGNTKLKNEHLEIFNEVINSKQSKSITEKVKNKILQYTYIHKDLANSDLYKDAIIMIISDITHEKKLLKNELFKIIIIFSIVIVISIILLYIRSKSLTQPIEFLVKTVNRITRGEHTDKIIISGNNEIAKLSEDINLMMEKIEERNKKIETQSKILKNSNTDLNTAYEILNKQKKIIESKNRDLTSSLIYALKVQRSFLPQISKLHELFDDAFILYQPKGIVSGDFYWFMKINNKIIIITADCTGHGVPGAFTSMISMTIIHQLVAHEMLFDPALILTKLDKEIFDMLKTSLNKENFFIDIDASVCCIDLDTNILQFSGARRPLFIINNDKIKSYKGEVHPVGEYYENRDKKFTSTNINIEKGDLIYMFSDGYTTQFSEKDQGKFMVQRFRELLLKIHKLPLNDQKSELINEFKEWKGNVEQVDDILILGFKY
ncbi:MAG: SpoIIE family protein phosphatase [Bacteroidales bacterium]|nr:SpoIIE family protein phosphatase [Bacteroidales bacterium]